MSHQAPTARAGHPTRDRANYYSVCRLIFFCNNTFRSFNLCTFTELLANHDALNVVGSQRHRTKFAWTLQTVKSLATSQLISRHTCNSAPRSRHVIYRGADLIGL